jgi:4-amino-4-deoxy-L-arabinose transferase-like glycosyltransferase
MSKRHALLVLLGITLLAAALRLWRLDDIPPGFWWDEGYHDWAALKILQGGPRPVYFTEASGGFEPLQIYLVALWFRLFGVHYLAPRWVSALAGTLAIPALYWAAVEWLSTPMSRPRARVVGLLAAATLSVILAHLLISRLGFQIGLAPTGIVLTVAALGRGLRTRRAIWFVLVGLLLGLTQYTYLAARVAPLIVAAWAAALLLLNRPTLRAVWPSMTLLVAVAVIACAPLGLFYLRHPEWFFGRMGVVSAGVRSGWLPLFASMGRTLWGLLLRGDMYPRHNLPGRPLLDPMQAALFLAGLGIVLWRARRHPQARGMLFIPLWLLIGLLPSALADGAPSFTRGLGAAPPAALLVALGAEHVWQFAHQRWGWFLPTALLIAIWSLSAILTINDYFVRYPARPEMFDTFGVGQWEVLTELRQASQAGPAYLSPVDAISFRPTVEFVLRTTPQIRHYDGRVCQVFPRHTEQDTTFALLLLDDPEGLSRLQAVFPTGVVAREILHEPEPFPFAAIFRVPAGAEAEIDATPTQVRFGDAVALVAYRYEVANGVLDVTLYWQSLAPMSVDYTVFVHLDADGQGTVSQHDGWPCDGTYPTTRWRSGEIVVEARQLALPTGQDADCYELYVGLYDLLTMQRLPITGADVPCADNRAHVTTITPDTSRIGPTRP